MQGTGTHSFSSNDAHALTHHRPCVSFLGLPQCSVTNWMTSNMLSSPSHGSRSRGLGSGCPWATVPQALQGRRPLASYSVWSPRCSLAGAPTPQPQPPSSHHHLTSPCISVLSHPILHESESVSKSPSSYKNCIYLCWVEAHANDLPLTGLKLQTPYFQIRSHS